MEVLRLKHLILLSKDEYNAPKVRNQPSVNRLISSICCDEDVWYFGKQAFKREFFQIRRQGILINIDNLIRHTCIMLNLLVPVAHRLIVSVLDATLDIAEEQGLPPADEPLS